MRIHLRYTIASYQRDVGYPYLEPSLKHITVANAPYKNIKPTLLRKFTTDCSICKAPCILHDSILLLWMSLYDGRYLGNTKCYMNKFAESLYFSLCTNTFVNVVRCPTRYNDKLTVLFVLRCVMQDVSESGEKAFFFSLPGDAERFST